LKKERRKRVIEVLLNMEREKRERRKRRERRFKREGAEMS
jgi:hypothetical protein